MRPLNSQTPFEVALPVASQGLSDFRKAALPAVGEMIDENRCYLYVTKRDDSLPTGAVLLQFCTAHLRHRHMTRQSVRVRSTVWR